MPDFEETTEDLQAEKTAVGESPEKDSEVEEGVKELNSLSPVASVDSGARMLQNAAPAGVLAQANVVAKMQDGFGNEYTQKVIRNYQSKEPQGPESKAIEPPGMSAPPGEEGTASGESKVVETEQPESASSVPGAEEPTETGGVEEIEVSGNGGSGGAGEGGNIPDVATPAESEIDAETPKEETSVVEEVPEDAGAGEVEASGGGGGGAGGGGAPAGGGGEVEIIMPEPEMELNEEENARVSASQGAAGGAAASAAEMPSADEGVAEARAAVEEPSEESNARAEGALVDALGERPEPSPEIEELCDRIKDMIESKRPPDEDRLVDADPEEMAREAGGELNDNVSGDTERVAGEYDSVNEPQEGEAATTPEPIEGAPEVTDLGDLNAEAAIPNEVPAEEVNLDTDRELQAQAISDANMDTDVAAESRRGDPGGHIDNAMSTQEELGEMAERDPAEVLAEQNEARVQAGAEMASLQTQALEALQAARSDSVSNVGGQQVDMTGSEAEIRRQLSQRSQEIFSSARTRVNELLTPLPQTAMGLWETGVATLSTEFEQHLQRVADWIEERHSGVGGAVVGVWDAVAGLPDWVTDEYDDAEQAFADGVCDLIRNISRQVNGVVAACQTIIANAQRDIDNLFSQEMPESLRAWAEAERANMQGELNGLSEQAENTRRDFNQQLIQSASQAVDDARTRIHELRQAARGLIGQIQDAIAAFLDDPFKFIIEGLLKLVGIPPPSFWALIAKIGDVIEDIANDPVTFGQNLLRGVGQGFQQFFDNIGTHLLEGFIDWLFSGLGSVGVQIPPDFSLKSLITFFLQLMGITWPRIREVLVREIGEQNVALLEQVWELVTVLIEEGPEGIFNMIEPYLDPANILDMIIDAAIDFLVEALVANVTPRIIALFNPAGAIVQAIEAIYKVLKWIFENAARIFSFVESVVNGMADVMAGNIAGVANNVELALKRLIVPVIDFVAGYVGLSGLPDFIAEQVKRLQSFVWPFVERAVVAVVNVGRRALAAIGLGGGEEEEEDDDGDYDGQIGKTVRFSAAGESHRLWIETNGTDAVLKVASTPKTLDEQLDEYTRLAQDLDEEEKTTVTGHISTARDLGNQINNQADTLAANVQNPNSDPDANSSADDAVESKEQQLAGVLRQIEEILGLADEEWGTSENPLGLDWPKRASAAYPTMYFGPKAGRTQIPQSVLAAGDKEKIKEDYLTTRQATRWENAGEPLESFSPHGRKQLPMGGITLGVSSPNRVSVGKKFKLTPGSTEGAGWYNNKLKAYGFSPAVEYMDGDHVVEMQVGGRNVEENLWPLDASENRSSGSTLSRADFRKSNGDTVPMSEVKTEAAQREVWFRIDSTL